MRHEIKRGGGDRYDDPVKSAIFLAVLVAGFLAVHFGVAPIW
jgi:hypothetical protein